MRLFTGIPIPQDTGGRLSLVLDRLRPVAHLKWSPPYNLHITTAFIGEWPDNRLPELVEALRPLGSSAPFDISIRGLGWFPNPHAPRILFAGVSAEPALHRLAKSTNEVLQSLGIQCDERDFSAHVTLARVTDPAVPLDRLRQAIAQLDTVDAGRSNVRSFSLYRSEPGPAGSIYTQLAEIPLSQ